MDYKEEEIEVPPLLVYERDPRSGLFKFNPQKSVIPRSALNQLPDEFNRYSQADRDKVMRNIELQEVMDKLIRQFQDRDTKTNILKIQEELDELAAATNPLKKCLSMYKIKEKMDKIENFTL